MQSLKIALKHTHIYLVNILSVYKEYLRQPPDFPEPNLIVAFYTGKVIRMNSKIDAMQIHCLKSVVEYESNCLNTVTLASMFLAADKDTDISVAV